MNYCIREYIYSKQNFANLKSLAMLMIIFHHVLKEFFPLSGTLEVICNHFGYLGAGVCFFLSGYGLSKSFEKKEKIGWDWVKNKCKKLYLPFIFAFAVSFLLIILFKKDFSLQEIVKDYFIFSLPNKTTWFYKIILGFYVIMPIAYRLSCNNLVRTLVVLAITLFYFIIVSRFADSYWYNTVLNFPAGMVLANCSKLRETKTIITITTLSVIVLVVAFFFYHIPTFIVSLCFSYAIVSIYGLIPVRLGNLISAESIKYYLFHVVLLEYVMLLNCGVTITFIVLLVICTILIYTYNRVFKFLSI